MHRINKEFDKVVAINLAERKDKREKTQKKFDRLGIEVEWYTAVKYDFLPTIVPQINKSNQGYFNPHQPYEFGAALSHYHVIKQALIEGAENIFVFEDDVLFHKDFNRKFDDYFDDLPQNWDSFLLYSFMYELYPQNQKLGKNWVRAFKSWSLMTYGMRKRFMQTYIERQNRFFTISDKCTFQMQELNDGRDYTFLNLVAAPSLCLPDTEMGSNIRGENMNYETTPTVTNWGTNNKDYE